ncbi:MAG: aldehyde ferredoxin oxidoreductase C-terminal domain-containing protein [Thermodesulfobacteriota bacterium]|nr:aldehyde ferredoxin oxidoreductase C-terminal domain-containing protein [Thermodesulfobacteriota bacterium]
MKTMKSLTYKPHSISNGYTDKILQVNLSSQNISILSVPSDFKEKYIGGRGYALRLIWEQTTENTCYDSPENLLVMAGGPLGNEPLFPGSGKFIAATLSPLTNTFIDSNVGGHFAPLLKICGFDALAISGTSGTEVVLTVDGDKGVIEISRAPSFGEETDEGALSYGHALLNQFCEGDLNENTAVVTTGIGAANAKFGIINSLFYDRRRKRLRSKQAGRGGTGTVMRHKGLRAVVVRSTLSSLGSNNPSDATGVKRAGADLKKVISQVDPVQLNLASWGTPVLVEYMDKYHILPVNNYQQGQHQDSKAVFADVFLDRYLDKKIPDGCYKGCNLACAKGAKDITLTHGPHKGTKVSVDGPEYETVAAVTCMGIFDPQYIMEYNWYCDEYGLDTISMGVTASFLMECVQRGFLTTEEVGYDLQWGDIGSADRLLHETAHGTGFGRIGSLGVKEARRWIAENHAAKTGIPLNQVIHELNKFAMESKGLEFSMYITKESLAQQGGYGFSLKGPQHDEAWLIFIDQVHQELPTFEMKAKALKWFPLIRTWFNAVGLCKLPWIDVRHPEASETDNPAQNQPTLAYYVAYFNAMVGSNKTLEDILNDSERLHLLQKMINIRHGKGTRRNDQIPLRAMAPAFLDEYLGREAYYDEWLRQRGEGKGVPEDLKARHEMLVKLRKEDFDHLCDAVYTEKGYSQDAIPLSATLERFDLLDEQARQLLDRFGIEEKARLLSN